MKDPEWWEVLEPRRAFIAGSISFVVVLILMKMAYVQDYLIYGFHPSEYRGAGLAAAAVAFAAIYLIVKHASKKR